MRLVYSDEALADLVRLRNFIASSNPNAAARVAAELIARVNHLCDFPEMGRSVPRAPDPDTVRDFTFGKYVVRYTFHGDTLIVLRIWHHYENR